MERDERTIFATNLPLRATEAEIIDFFSDKAGDVSDIRLITDRNSRRHKGFAYIEFEDRETVPAGLALSGKKFFGYTIQVQQSQAEKNRAAGISAPVAVPLTSGPTTLYIGGLPIQVSERDLRPIFEAFGQVDSITVIPEPDPRKAKSYAYVQYHRGEDARRSMHQVNGMDIGGRKVVVGLVNEPPKSERSSSSGNAPSSSRSSIFDEDETRGNAPSRAMLMAKLQRGEGPIIDRRPIPASTSPVAPSSPVTAVTPLPVAIRSPCILLRNMFDPTQETEEDWDKEIKDDVKEECGKFGNILHIFVDKTSAGHVWLKFSTVTAAQAALSSLDKRWFAGQMISAEFIDEKEYTAKFPDA